MRSLFATVVIALTLTSSLSASAAVFVNGIKVDRVEEAVDIEQCTVRFDENGDVHITTPPNVLVLDSGKEPAEVPTPPLSVR